MCIGDRVVDAVFSAHALAGDELPGEGGGLAGLENGGRGALGQDIHEGGGVGDGAAVFHPLHHHVGGQALDCLLYTSGVVGGVVDAGQGCVLSGQGFAVLVEVDVYKRQSAR